jgi:hypothetical protein
MDLDAEGVAELAEAVGGQPRDELTARAHGAEALARIGVTQARKLFPQETIVKIYVVGHKCAAIGELDDLLGDFIEAGSGGDHGICDACDIGDIARDRALRIDQGAECMHDTLAVVYHDGDLGDAIFGRTATGRFQVDYSIHACSRVIRGER